MNDDTEALRFMADTEVQLNSNQGENDIRMTKLQQVVSTRKRTPYVLPFRISC
jgi:hypothetical protein